MKGSRFKLNQNHAPIHEALETFRRMRVVPFDVPGHKRGRGNPELTEFLGQKCVGVDVNSMKPLDNLCHPVSVIREAEELAAAASTAWAFSFKMFDRTFQCKPKQNNYDQYYNYIYHYLSPLLNSSSFFCSLFFLSH